MLGGSAVALTSVPGLGKSISNLFASRKIEVLKYKVNKMKLPVTVMDRGSLESSNNKDVINEVEGSTTIISITEEGKLVKKGDLVCELDSAGLRDQLTNQEITTKRAEADLEQAKKTLEVAEIGVREYIEGTFPESEQSAEGQIKLAESELIRAQERLEWSDRMLQIGYVTQSANMSDRLTLQRAEFSLREAETKLKVLRIYTKEKQLKELQATVEKARSDMYARQSTYELEKEKEQKLKAQIEKCKLYAPADGLVVYANEQNRFGGSNQALIEEGAAVRERQAIFRLPDISKMRVNTKVHESMVDKVKVGMKARIRVEAFPDQLTGTVESVQPLPDPSSFFSSDIKVYTTQVAIDNPLTSLRPGMSAEVEILVTQLDDVLAIPVMAILQFEGKDHVYVSKPDGWDRREIKLGISNDKLIEVKDGLLPGDEVALSPLALMSEQEKRQAFSVASKGGGMGGEWSSDAIKAGASPGAIAAGGGPPGAPGEAKKEGGDAAKKKRGAGGGGPPGMAGFREKFQKVSAEDRAKLFNPETSETDRTDIMKKAGFTDEEIQQMSQMRAQFGGGGGPPGGGGGGGFGGGGRPGGGGPGGGGGGPSQ